MTNDGRKEAVEACRQWSQIRARLLNLVGEGQPSVARSEIDGFDEQMFRLGEQVFTAEGEVTNVERLT